MKLRVDPPEIDQVAPFKNDLLSREESADALTNLLRSTDDCLVLCIGAPWGEGKTTFLKMWRQKLMNEGVPTIYFSAWENDFSDDAFVSLVGELEAGIDLLDLDADVAGRVKDHLQRAKKVGAALVKRALPAALKIATAGLVDCDDLTEQVLSDLVEKVAAEKIQRYEAARSQVRAFREELGKVAHLVSTRVDTDRGGPLVVFVDELDRCRPTYALEVLERAKHLFAVPHVVFVLAVDRKQLSSSVQCVYGQGIDTAGYLRRFIDLDFRLPSPGKGVFCRAQFARFGLEQILHQRGDAAEVELWLTELAELFGLSLREQEACFSLLSVALRITLGNEMLFPSLMTLLIVLKIEEPNLFCRTVERKASGDEILDCIRSKTGGGTLLKEHMGTELEGNLLASGLLDLGRYKSTADAASTPEPEKDRALAIISYAASMQRRPGRRPLEYVAAKLDIASRFSV